MAEMVATNFAEISSRIESILHDAFPNASVVTNEGWQGRVHVKIVSPFFNRYNEHEKQAMIYDALNQKLGADSQAVSLALVYGTDEL